MRQYTRFFLPLLSVALLLALLPGATVLADFGVNWSVSYYNNATLSGAPVTNQTGLAGVNFNWGSSSPDPAVPSDNFSARFTSVQTFAQGAYTFQVSSDDGVRVFIDGVVALDRFIPRPLTTDTFTFNMTAGNHNLVVEYFESTDQAIVQVQWFAPGAPPVPSTPGTPTGPTATLHTVRGLAVRTGPYLGASMITTALPGTAYTVHARNTDEGVYTWYLITVGEHTGWSSGRYLTLSVDPNSLPVQGSVFDTLDGAPDTGTFAAPRAYMNLRRRPSIRSQILALVPWGAQVPMLNRTIQGGQNRWYQVRYNGQVGWIFAPFITVRGDLGLVPVR